VIVPTYRRPGQLAECLEALARLEYPRDRLEAIVVDDGGGEPLDDIVAAVRDRLDVALIRQEHAGPSTARNAAVARARGDLLVFTDDDCRPAYDWLQRLSSAHSVAPDALLGGHTVNALDHNSYSAVSQLIIDAGYERHNSRREEAAFFTTNNLAVPAAGLRRLGGFDPRLRTSEDRDFCDRWTGAGGRMHYIPEALVHHFHFLTFRSFCEQHFRYGRGACLFHRLHRERESERIRLEPSFYLGLHGDAFRRYRYRHAARIQALLLVWHVANAAGYLWEALVGVRPGSSEDRGGGQRRWPAEAEGPEG
jgi:GT2 family glycosyltransferase